MSLVPVRMRGTVVFYILGAVGSFDCDAFDHRAGDAQISKFAARELRQFVDCRAVYFVFGEAVTIKSRAFLLNTIVLPPPMD